MLANSWKAFMSRCYWVKSEDFVNLKTVRRELQKSIGKDFAVKVDKYEDEPGGRFYIENEAARGVEVYKDEDEVVVKVNALGNHADYVVAKMILDYLCKSVKAEVFGENDEIIAAPLEYFTDEKIQELREQDCGTFFLALNLIMKDEMQIDGVLRKVYFGKGMLAELSKHKDNPAELVEIFEKMVRHVQYELPNYEMPGAALVFPKDCKDETQSKKIRMMFDGTDYIIQDYDYLLICEKEPKEESLLINNADLIEICSKVYKKGSGFELADDFTVVFPKLSDADWEKFVALAREKNHTEIFEED